MNVIELRHASGICPIYTGTGLLGTAPLWERHLSGRVLVVTDEHVAGLYLDRLEPALSPRRHERLVLPRGESGKTLDCWREILEALVALGAQRDSTVIALGGGAVGDAAGFAAACYMRGIRLIQAPTTLLAQVDAAIGGKTGVNLPHGKNLVGAFHQPEAVIADLDTLASLDERDYRSGLAEVVKHAAIRDAVLFERLEGRIDAIGARLPEALTEVIQQAQRCKAEIVMQDERESGVRAVLNFGHTFGHALETATSFSDMRHGEAVAVGMVLAVRVSEEIGLAPPGLARRVRALLESLGLPVTLPPGLNTESLLEIMRLDKKNRDERLHLVLLEDIGQARLVSDVPAATLRKILDS